MSWEEFKMTWDEIDFDLWYGEVTWMFIRNKEGIPTEEACQWFHHAGYGPGQTYYKMSNKHSLQVKNDSNVCGSNGPAGSAQ